MNDGDGWLAAYEDYSHSEIVATVDGDAVELAVCDRCGAVVRALSMTTHDEWHAKTG